MQSEEDQGTAIVIASAIHEIMASVLFKDSVQAREMGTLGRYKAVCEDMSQVLEIVNYASMSLMRIDGETNK